VAWVKATEGQTTVSTSFCDATYCRLHGTGNVPVRMDGVRVDLYVRQRCDFE